MTATGRAGLVFVLMGLLAILAPAVATLAIGLLVAILLLLWGAAGIAWALSMRPQREWLPVLVLSLMVLALGLIFLLRPGVGVETLTTLLVVVLLAEGLGSILLALRLRALLPRWGWMAASGAASLLLALVILSGWPGTAAWTLGLLLGINFLTTGLALVLLDTGR